MPNVILQMYLHQQIQEAVNKYKERKNMKKYAMTLAELLIAMTLIGVLALLTVKSLKIFIKDDTNVYKFRPVLASVSEAIYQMIDDTTMYPTKNGLAYTERGQYEDDDKVYEGETKFRKLFKSKFNVLNNEIKFADNSVGMVPLYRYKSASDEDKGKNKSKTEDDDKGKIKAGNFSDLHCFTENKGITYCLSDTPKTGLTEIYIRVYLNTIDKDKEPTFDNKKAVYFVVSKTGKISVPPKITNGKDVLFDCYYSAFKDYTQCRVRNRVTEIDIYTNDAKKANR